ncbi:MAG: hypothetical protein K9L86_00685 [Candidatus Omnitrophica bacterium]|nr:hypothetical protein [Candidatus Omnitrophota bacterium]
MKNCLFMLLFFIILSLIGISAFPFSENYIEFNLNNREIKLVDFNLGDYALSGDFSLGSYQDQGSLIYEVEGRNVSIGASEGSSLTFGDKTIPWLALKAVKRGEVIFIEQLCWPQALIKGSIDLAKSNFSLDINTEWDAANQFLEGHLKVSAKAWGSSSNFSLSGFLTIDQGTYKGREFAHLRLDLLGKPPVLNITDSEFVMTDGTVATLEGDKVLDLRNLYSYIPQAEYRAKKAFIDEWQLFSEDESRFGLKKSLDENIDVSVGTDKQEDSASPDTELRYRMKDDKYLKLKMQENSTVIGIEKRRDF